nr:hypothetical protein [uncultured Desulfobulbus sp.]
MPELLVLLRHIVTLLPEFPPLNLKARELCITVVQHQARPRGLMEFSL